MLHAGLLRQSGQHAGTGFPTPEWSRRFEMLARNARDKRLKAYYEAGMVSGDTPLSAVPLMGLDVETTGLNPQTDGIVSNGLVPEGLERIRASESRHWTVKPRARLGEESVTIHGITDSQVLAAPDLEVILADVLQCLAGHVLIVHCRDIERQFLNRALIARIGGKGITVLLIEHHMDLVMAVSDHVVVLDYGAKIAEGAPSAIQGNPRVIAAYLGVDDEDQPATAPAVLAQAV